MKIELSDKDQPGDPEGFSALLVRCYQKEKDSDLAEMREVLRDRPELYNRVFSLAAAARSTLIEKIIDKGPAGLAIKANIRELKRELNYDQVPTIERLLIENILTCWLRYQWVEIQLAEFMGTECTYAQVQHWEKRLTLSQGRYLRAVETLARVRKLALPPMQVNIANEGGQQVNIAGDLVKR